MKSEEAQLVEACRRKDQRAFKRLYDYYAPVMFGVCLRFTRSKSDAEDVLHDGFIKVFQTIDKLRDVDSLGGWIRSIMIFTAINSNRRKLPVAEMQSDNDLDEANVVSADMVYDSLDREFILDAIQKLPDQYRMVFNLCEIEGYSLNDAADLLKIGQSTVRSNLTRAKHKLAELLAPYL